MPLKTFEDYSLVQDWDDFQLTEDFEKILEEANKIVKEMGYMVKDFLNILDPNLIAEFLLNLALYDIGMDPLLDFPEVQLSTEDKRKLLLLAVRIYQQKGVADGIRNIVRLLLKVDIKLIFQYNVDVWKLGEDGFSELGDTTVMGPEGEDQRRLTYSFDIDLNDVVSDELKAKIRAVANYMKPAHTHLVNINQLYVIEHWSLGESELEETTLLHENPE